MFVQPRAFLSPSNLLLFLKLYYCFAANNKRKLSFVLDTSVVVTRLMPQKSKNNKGVCGTKQSIKWNLLVGSKLFWIIFRPLYTLLKQILIELLVMPTKKNWQLSKLKKKWKKIISWNISSKPWKRQKICIYYSRSRNHLQ